ncbi:MAG: nicotinate-nucleotide adenylyltransferase [Acidobacteria bacterium]|nr:nicotinate-nucleotide adenylyltransferase [Acidobacteriota bacterium]
MRIGLYGGTFDPPHLGHLHVARAARDSMQLDVVEMLTSSIPPHRRPTEADPFDRFAMTVLAAQDEPRIIPSPREVRRGGVSYTVETLLELRTKYPGATLFLVIGADAYDELPTWHRAGEILQLAHLAVLPRPGSHGVTALRPEDRQRLRQAGEAGPSEGLAVYQVPMELVPISAREIRRRLRAGEPVDDMVPVPVLRYIRKRGLYNS